MLNALIKASVIACFLGGLALTVPVYAAEDMETEAVEENMRPDEVQSDSMESTDKAKPKAAAPKEGAMDDDADEKAVEEGMGQGE